MVLQRPEGGGSRPTCLGSRLLTDKGNGTSRPCHRPSFDYHTGLPSLNFYQKRVIFHDRERLTFRS
jgi:hypothetical protein